jgi:hypothetical protein
MGTPTEKPSFPQRAGRWLRALPLPALMMILVSAAVASLAMASGRTKAPEKSPVEEYRDAIHNAAVWDSAAVLPLKPVRPDSQGNVRVVAFTNYHYARGDNKVGIYLWVTLVPEVHDSCHHVEGDARLRMIQLLGLPPTVRNDTMVEMTVPASALFRPTNDPATNTRFPCGDGIVPHCGEKVDSADAQHVLWMETTFSTRWQEPDGYPWTRLGYTYDWSAESRTHYGASEYVLKPGTLVHDAASYPVRRYCAMS